eukprot:m.49708 g.49708  ORF g.49708 m.49708 type:complete len:73 (-) comp10624_c0_seq4:966-1184(-)
MSTWQSPCSPCVWCKSYEESRQKPTSAGNPEFYHLTQMSSHTSVAGKIHDNESILKARYKDETVPTKIRSQL